jgi:hypothetical protein
MPVAHLRRVRATCPQPLAHMCRVCAISLAGSGRMCARRTHIPLVRANEPRTSPWFRPASRPDDTKPAEVSAHIPRFPGISRAHLPVSCHFWASCSRTSPGFPAASRDSGRKPALVRERLAGIRHMCVARTHIPSVPATPLARIGCMCAGRAAHMRVGCWPNAAGRSQRARARTPAARRGRRSRAAAGSRLYAPSRRRSARSRRRSGCRACGRGCSSSGR